MGKQAVGNLFQRNEGFFVERGTRKKRRKKKGENKEIIIRGGGRKYPKLVFIVVTLACCYGNSKSHFKDGLGGLWLPSVPCIQ